MFPSSTIKLIFLISRPSSWSKVPQSKWPSEPTFSQRIDGSPPIVFQISTPHKAQCEYVEVPEGNKPKEDAS